ncbi:DUF2612 domain-containing protein [Pseudomonas agarici]|uniref:DUF2612 domain-containing protein n=1 Tax=Pseudomonas agarici TaxID=46677 RepID=UPI00030E6050|nr:DUF2612 domain-containing protein [Pseudomonas agarici]NWC11947.1 DUF2612 domain-containing protein [Pseudomonas agarici]SEL85799.1 Protein of unknown function [Pseudomonas agarici]
MENYKDTILSQYANSPTITAMIDAFNQWIDPSADIDNFYSVVWNVNTAVGFGLDIWGKIVNVSRELQISNTPAYLGFDEAFTVPTAATGAQPFGQAPMYNGPLATTTYTLADDAYRKLIMVKALANITDCTSPSLNALLRYLFAGEGRCYVVDTGGMQMRYVFEFTLSPVDLAIMLNSGAIPRSAGVLVSVMQLDPATTFGFAEASLQPFGQGVFFSSSGIQNAN